MCRATEYTEQVQTNLCKLQEEEEERKEGTKTRNAMVNVNVFKPHLL